MASCRGGKLRDAKWKKKKKISGKRIINYLKIKVKNYFDWSLKK